MKFDRIKLSEIFVAMLVILNPGTATASDHIDYPSADTQYSENPSEVSQNVWRLDLSDHYAWVPGAGKLAIAMNTIPQQLDNSGSALEKTYQFDTTATYRFRLKKVSHIETRYNSKVGIPTLAKDSAEVTIDCKFVNAGDQQIPDCRVYRGNTSQSLPLSSLKVSAGKRVDAFNFDVVWAKKYITQTALIAAGLRTGPITAPKPLDLPVNHIELARRSVANITIQLETKDIFPGYHGMIASAVEVKLENGNIFDRIGRPEITNMTMINEQVKYAYNSLDVFNMSSEQIQGFSQLMESVISSWDSQDGELNWSPADLKDLVKMLVNDFLVVDLSGVCSTNRPNTYLDIEKSVGEKKLRSCGGRMPGGTFVNTMVSYYVGGPNAEHNSFGPGSKRFIGNVPKAAFPFFLEEYHPGTPKTPLEQ